MPAVQPSAPKDFPFSDLVAIDDFFNRARPRCTAGGMDKRSLFSPRALIVVATASGALAACSGHDDAGGNQSALAANGAQPAAVCNAPDAQAPAIEEHTLSLWPPNHKFHRVAAGDCVSAVDACGNALQGEFIWASSDEPIDDIGDGHFGPDIGLAGDTSHACVRAERQGPKDGRVYKLGVRVTDSQRQQHRGRVHGHRRSRSARRDGL